MINISSARRIRMSNHVMAIVNFKRPSTSVSWWADPAENASIQPHITTTYFDSGKALERTTVLSEDQLNLTIRTLWTSNELRNAYTKDPIVRNVNLKNKKYFNEVGIESTWENIEYVDNTDTEIRRWSGTLNDTRHLDELTT
jgi:hypothetical protein